MMRETRQRAASVWRSWLRGRNNERVFEVVHRSQQVRKSYFHRFNVMTAKYFEENCRYTSTTLQLLFGEGREISDSREAATAPQRSETRAGDGQADADKAAICPSERQMKEKTDRTQGWRASRQVEESRKHLPPNVCSFLFQHSSPLTKAKAAPCFHAESEISHRCCVGGASASGSSVRLTSDGHKAFPRSNTSNLFL